MKKRILSLILSFSMLLSLCVTTAWASEPEPEQELDSAPTSNETVVAQVGESTYATLAEAVAAVTSENNKVTLLGNLELPKTLNVVNKTEMVLDLGGHTLSSVGKSAIRVYNSTLTIENGTVQITQAADNLKDVKPAIGVDRKTDLTIAADATIIGSFAIAVQRQFSDTGEKNDAGEGTQIHIYGTLKGINDEDHLATGGRPAITVNGYLTSTEEGKYPTIHIYDGAKLTGYTGTTNNVNLNDAPAVYAAGYAEWIIEDGAELTGDEALSIKSGKFVINGGTFNARGDYHDPAAPNNNGTEATGAAVSITNNTSYISGTSIEINGGTFISEKGHALYEGLSSATESYVDVVSITDGVFTSAADKAAVSVKSTGGIITGGTFSSDPSAYVHEDYRAVKESEGTYSIGSAYVAEADGTQYKSVTAAITAANGGTVKLIQDTTEDVTIPSNTTLTLDLNGRTLKIAEKEFTVKGNLTLIDSTASVSVDGDYKVTYSGGKVYSTGDPAIQVCEGGKLTLQSGMVKSTGGNGINVVGSDTMDGWATPVNSVATVKGGYVEALEYGIGVYGNGAKLTVEGGVVLANDNAAIAGNGSYDQDSNGDGTKDNYGGTIIDIKGGTLIGHIKTDGYIATGIYHPQSGVLNISGGTIYAQNGVGVCVRNGEVNISDNAKIVATGNQSGRVGDASNQIPGKALVIDYASDYNHNNGETDDTDTRKVSVTGGYLSSELASVEVYTTKGNKEVGNFISGGSFSSDPTAYLAAGKVALLEKGWYVVRDKKEEAAAVVPAEPEVKTSNDVPPEAKDKVAAAAKEAAVDELGVLANGVANENKVSTDTGKNELLTAGVIKNAEEAEKATVTIVVQPYLDIQATSYEETDKTKTLTLDITPMYRTVATTEDVSQENAEIIVQGEEGEGGDTANAVPIGTPQKLPVTEPVTVTIPLPAGFVASDADLDTVAEQLFVKHVSTRYGTHYYVTELAEIENASGDTAPTHTITFTNPHGFSEFTVMTDTRTGKIAFDKDIGEKEYTPANVGEKLPVPSIPSGKSFGGWTIDGRTYTTLTDDLLTKLSDAKGQPLDAEPYFYTPSSGDSGSSGSSTSSGYAVTVETNRGGDVTASAKRAYKGDTVILTVEPDDGYELDELIVTDKYGDALKLTEKKNGKFTFEMPASAVTVEAVFVKVEERAELEPLPFTDLSENDWFYDAAAYAYREGLMSGTSAATFAPGMTTTRGMIVTILHRLAGEPKADAARFDDVAPGQYYTEAVAWANANGIVDGYGNGLFGPNDPITREQMAAILYRYASYRGYDVSRSADLSGFVDAGLIGSYAQTAMAWANAEGLITGKGGGLLDPKGSATRAEVATILMRFVENVAE